MLVLFISYVDFSAADSGSGMRPQKMYEAFLREGHEVKLLCGQQGTFRSRETRRRAVAEISAWLDSHRPDLCYIESPVYPILWSFDRRLIRKICRMGIPTGYFYRDFYRKFPTLFPRRKDPVGRAKELFLDLQQRRTDRTLECVDIVYLPSMEASSLFSYGDMRPLPPGGEDHLADAHRQKNRCVYVGGVLGHYDGEMLLRAFRLLNAGDESYPLTLICREKEWAQIPDELKTGDWLEVRHASGEALIPLLSQAGAGLLIGRADHPYSRLAVSVKTYEYLGYGLPVVYVRCPPLDRIVEQAGAGFGVDGTPEAYARGIKKLFADEENYKRLCRGAEGLFENDGQWKHRVRKVVSDLTGE